MQKRWGNRKFSSEHHRSIYCRQEPLMLKLVKKAQGRQNIREDPQNLESICKKLCIYSYMFKPQSPSKYSPFDAIHLSRCFSTAQNSFCTHQFWCLLVPLSFFPPPLPHWQNVSLWGLFSFGETKKNHLGWDWMNREGGTWGSYCFWLKTAEYSAWCGQVLLPGGNANPLNVVVILTVDY